MEFSLWVKFLVLNCLFNEITARDEIRIKEKNILVIFTFKLNISLAANLTIYTNKTINPPTKIKNIINENHLVLILAHTRMHTTKVWHKIKIISIAGCELCINTILSAIDANKIILMSEQDLFYIK